MTAQRWWVRRAARWLARIDGVSGQIRLAMLIMTGLSTATLTLQQYGHGKYAWPLIGVTGLFLLGFTYLYTEGGVWNQMARDRRDLSNNFAGPNARISNEMLARSLAAWDKGDELSDTEVRLLKSELNNAFFDLRTGVNLEEEEREN